MFRNPSPFKEKTIPKTLHIDFIAACCLLAHGSTSSTVRRCALRGARGHCTALGLLPPPHARAHLAVTHSDRLTVEGKEKVGP